MHPRQFALIGGIIMLLAGVLSLVPGWEGTVQNLPFLKLETSYGLFLGFIPMNIINKVALIALGLWGIGAYSSQYASLPQTILWSRVVFYFTGIGTILGLIPQTNTFFGYWPLFGGDIILHGLFCLAGAYFGYALSAKVPDQGPSLADLNASARGTR